MKKQDKYEKTIGKLLGDFIVKRRKELKIKQSTIYETLNVNRITVYNYEKNRVRIPLSNLVKICEMLDFEVKMTINKKGINVLFEREEDKLIIKNEDNENEQQI